MRVAVCGLGKLGSCVAAVIANAGHTVVGYDVDEAAVDAINERRSRHREPGLDRLLVQATDLAATTDLKFVAAETDLALIVVPTPSKPDGSFDSSMVEAVAEALGDALDEVDPRPYTIVVCSTTTPGTVGRVARDADPYRVVYSPMFIALGNVIQGLTQPDMVLLGGAPGDCEFVGNLIRSYTHNCPQHVMPIESAELTKLMINVSLSMKIGIGNTVGRLAAALGVDPDPIVKAIGDDHRIGPALLRPGGPPGGPCLPRDLVALQALAWAHQVDAPMAKGTIDEGVAHTESICQQVTQALGDPGEGGRVTPRSNLHVAILGATYKAHIPVPDECLAIRMIEQATIELHPWRNTILVVDPDVNLRHYVSTLHPQRQANFRFSQVGADAALELADVVVIGTPGLGWATRYDLSNKKVIDPWT